MLAMFYILNFAMLDIFNIKFYLISSFGLLGLIPVIDYYIYLCAEVIPEDEIPVEIRITHPVNFEKLWKWYVDTFDNYSVAWMRTGSNMNEIQRHKDNNTEQITDLIGKYTYNHMDGIIEDCDLTEAFIQIKPLLDWTEKNGKSVLVALDIPQHFSGNRQTSYVQEIADSLKDILSKEFVVYNADTPRASLNSGIVIAPLTKLSNQDLEPEWLSRIGLITVVNLFDKGISNLFECRKFCFLLKSVNNDYQLLFINPYRRGTEPSLRNTWITRNQITEKKLTLYLHAVNQFYIGYNFEDYKDRFNKILPTKPLEPLYSGLELASIAISDKFKDETKPVTPVNYLDLAYTPIIEGKEELGKFCSQIDESILNVSAININQNIFNHLYPIEHIRQDKIFSVIFDQENNAPAAFAKWAHLGHRDNFSIVVSRPYLFRDYFNANLDYFVAAPFSSLQPHLSKSSITLTIILLDILRKTSVEERQLREIIRSYCDDKEIKSVSGIVRQLFDCYFASSIANSLQTSLSVSFKDKQYHHNTYYRLDLKTAYLCLILIW